MASQEEGEGDQFAATVRKMSMTCFDTIIFLWYTLNRYLPSFSKAWVERSICIIGSGVVLCYQHYGLLSLSLVSLETETSPYNTTHKEYERR